MKLDVNVNELPTEISNKFQPLPTGTYQALLTEVDEQDDGTIKFVIDITAGEYKGRKHYEWHTFSVDNADHQWRVDKAREFLGSLINATNSAEEFRNGQDTSVLMNKPFMMDLKVYQGKAYQDKHTGAMVTPNPKNLLVGLHQYSAAAASAQAANGAQSAASGGSPW